MRINSVTPLIADGMVRPFTGTDAVTPVTPPPGTRQGGVAVANQEPVSQVFSFSYFSMVASGQKLPEGPPVFANQIGPPLTPSSSLVPSAEDSAAALARPLTGPGLNVTGKAGFRLTKDATQVPIRPGLLVQALPYPDTDQRSREVIPVHGNLAISTVSTVSIVSAHFFVAAGFANRFSPFSTSYGIVRPGVDSVVITSPYEDSPHQFSVIGRGRIKFRCIYGGGAHFTLTVYVVQDALFGRVIDGMLGQDFLKGLAEFGMYLRADVKDEVYRQPMIQQLARVPISTATDFDIYFPGGGKPAIIAAVDKQKPKGDGTTVASTTDGARLELMMSQLSLEAPATSASSTAGKAGTTVESRKLRRHR
jgi:hypothetical protein